MALVLLVCLTAAACTSSAAAGCTVGKAAPTFRTSDVDGHPIRLADYAGKRVIVNFWAAWCVPCQTEFPVLKATMASHGDVQVLGVIFQDSASNARRFLAEQHATWPGLVDPAGQIAKAYCVAQKPGIPVSVVVDGKGIIRARHLGPVTSVADAEKLLTPTGR